MTIKICHSVSNTRNEYDRPLKKSILFNANSNCFIIGATTPISKRMTNNMVDWNIGVINISMPLALLDFMIFPSLWKASLSLSGYIIAAHAPITANIIDAVLLSASKSGHCSENCMF